MMITKQELQTQIDELKITIKTLQEQVEAMPDDNNNPLFTPEKDEEFFSVYKELGGGTWEFAKYANKDGKAKHVYRIEKCAQLKSDANNYFDELRAMGEGIREGVEQWYIGYRGSLHFTDLTETKVTYKALFPTEKAAQDALEALGGVDAFLKANRNDWGIE